MNVIEKIKNSIESVTGLTFYYDTPQTLNQRLDNATYPCAMLNIVQSGAIVTDNGIIRERLTVEVLFVTLSRLDFDGLQVENDLDTMKLKAFQWLLSLMRQSHGLKIVSLNSTNRYYATDDAIYAAYGVNLTIDEVAGVSSCDFLG